jgi:pilus assembly protein CpaE
LKTLSNTLRKRFLSSHGARTLPVGRLRIACDMTSAELSGIIQQIESDPDRCRFTRVAWKQRYDCDVLVVELDPEITGSTGRIQELKKQSADSTILVLSPSNDGRKVGELFQQGADDVLCAPYQADDLINALARCSQRQKTQRWNVSPDEPGKIIGVLKAGGGVGATCVALNTASLLCDATMAIAVVDLDIQGGACALQLDMSAGIDVVDMIEASSGGVEVSLKQSSAVHASGLHLLPAPSRMLGHPDPKALDIPYFAANLRREFAASFIDFPQVFADWDLAMLRECDHFVIVTRLAVPNIRLASRLLSAIDALGVGNRPQFLVLNAHKKVASQMISISDAERALGRKFHIRVASREEAVSKAINEGVLLNSRSDCADLVSQFEQLADLLLSSSSLNEALS